jgi:glycosyltransferase involved in cell wall biosynthesis
VGTITRLSPEKAVGQLVRAVSLVHESARPVHLVIKGDGGPETTAVEQLAEELLGERCHWRDSADNEDLYAAMDVFALSSEREGYPLVLMEAAIRAVPAVSTRVGGIDRLIDDGLTGFLVSAGDSRAFGQALARLLSEPELRATMGHKAEDKANKQFTLEQMADRYSRVFGQAG